MLTITPAAFERLVQKLARKKATDDVALRCTRGGRGWRLRLDGFRSEDTAFAHQGRKVLLLDQEASDALADATLDVHGTAAGPRLTVLRNKPRV